MTDGLLTVLNYGGIFVFAMTGALVGVRKSMDVLGILVLAMLTGFGGGALRDVLLGSTPPAAVTEWQYHLTATVAAAIVYFQHQRVQRRERIILVLDAVGLSLFCVTGAVVASDAGLSVGSAAVLGTITAVGGGLLRDVVSGRVPVIFQGELYALPAMLGALVAGLVHHYELAGVGYVGAALLCLVWRLVAMHRGWSAPPAWGTR